MRDRWPVIAFTLLLGTAVGALLVQTIAAGVSCDATLAEVADNKKICGPVEFWMNRYQGALAAIFASLTTLGAAGLAWYAVQRQIRQAEQQSRLPQWQAATEALKALNRDASVLANLLSTMRSVAEGLRETEASHSAEQILEHYDAKLRDADVKIAEITGDAPPWSKKTRLIRRDLLQNLRSININCMETHLETLGQIADLSTGPAVSGSRNKRRADLSDACTKLISDNKQLQAKFIVSARADREMFEDECEHLRKQIYRDRSIH